MKYAPITDSYAAEPERLVPRPEWAVLGVCAISYCLPQYLNMIVDPSEK